MDRIRLGYGHHQTSPLTVEEMKPDNESLYLNSILDRIRLGYGHHQMSPLTIEKMKPDNERLRHHFSTEENWRGVIAQDRTHAEVCEAMPERLQIELTKACNFQCPHCGTHGTNELHKRFNRIPPMTEEMLDTVAEQAFPFVRRVALVGEGEPFFAPKHLLCRLIDHMEKTSTALQASTNGAALSDDLIDLILPVLNNMSFSLDAATADTFLKVRGSSRFEEVLQTTKRLIQRRDEVPAHHRFKVNLVFTLMKSNASELLDFLRMAAHLKANSVTVRLLLVHFPEFRDEQLFDQPDRVNPILEKAASEADSLGLSIFLPNPIQSVLPDAAHEQKEEDHFVPDRISCCFLWRALHVCTNGDVYPCSGLSAPKLGNLNEESLVDLWNGPLIRAMRSQLETNHPYPVCEHCWLREISFYDAPNIGEDYSSPKPKQSKSRQYDEQAFISKGI
jgi:radical SAM protein with 4Fe4S-binding SPASM domain